MRSLIFCFVFFHVLYFQTSAQVLTFSNTTVAACDAWNSSNVFGTFTRTVSVSGLPATLGSGAGLSVLRQINVQLGNASCKGNLSSYSFRLTSPAGTDYYFINGLTSTISNTWLNGHFRDHAALERIRDYSNTVQQNYHPYSIGYYRVDTAGSFSLFNGENPNGTWTFSIKENTVTEVSFERIDLVFGPPIITQDLTSFPANNECSGASCFDLTGVTIGTNNGYSATDPNYPGGTIGGCSWNGANNNSAWFSFTASASSAYITISGMMNTAGSGSGDMQPIVLQAPSTCTPPTIVPAGGCPDDESVNNRAYLSSSGGGTATAGNVYFNGITANCEFNLSGLTPGQRYFLYVDGNSGASSSFYIEGLSGILPCSANDTTRSSLNTCLGDSVFLGGANRNSSGTYVDSFRASTGRDSFLITQLTVLPNSSFSRNTRICSGDSIFLGGRYRITAGTYYDTLRSSNGCDSILISNLALIPISSSTRSISICSGDSVLLGGRYRRSNGSYYDTLLSISGCDSILRSDLSVLSVITANRNVILCNGDSIFAGGRMRYTGGIYNDTLRAFFGCDSIITTSVSIILAVRRDITDTLCYGDSLRLGSLIYFTTGDYYDTLNSFRACDSILHVSLFVRPALGGVQFRTICLGDSIIVGSSIYRSAGVYQDTLLSTSGCDSLVRTFLTVNNPITYTQRPTICPGDRVFVGSSVYSSNGTYFDTLNSSAGCDSIVQTIVTVLPNSYSRSISICEGSSFFTGGALQNSSGTYYDTLIGRTGCDSILATNLTVNPVDSTSDSIAICIGQAVNGNYFLRDTTLQLVGRNVYGCDSVNSLSIHISPIPVVIAGPVDTLIQSGQSVILYVNGASLYSWSNGVNSSLNPVTPDSSTVYYVRGTDINGCENTDTVRVRVNRIEDTLALAIPSGFTPNHDGLNDVFRIVASRHIKLELMQVYNRWGELIFESEDINYGWDGTFKNRDQPVSTYVYYVKVRSEISNKLLQYTGTITLIR